MNTKRLDNKGAPSQYLREEFNDTQNLEKIEKLKALLDTKTDELEKIRITTKIATLYRDRLKDPYNAILYFEKALDLDLDPEDRAIKLRSIGSIHLNDFNDYKQCIAYQAKSLRYTSEPHAIVSALRFMANVHLEQCKADTHNTEFHAQEAINYLKLSLALENSVHNRSMTMTKIGSAYAKEMNQTKRGIAWAKKSFKLEDDILQKAITARAISTFYADMIKNANDDEWFEHAMMWRENAIEWMEESLSLTPDPISFFNLSLLYSDHAKHSPDDTYYINARSCLEQAKEILDYLPKVREQTGQLYEKIEDVYDKLPRISCA